jgi:hypothetical protein
MRPIENLSDLRYEADGSAAGELVRCPSAR